MNRLANHFRRWTLADDAALRNYVREGLRAPEIARLMGRTRDGVYAHGNAIGIRFGRGNRPDIDTRARLCDLLTKDLSLARIARITGRTPATVYDIVRRLVADGAVVRIGPAKGSPGYNPRKVRFRPAHTEARPRRPTRENARTGKNRGDP